MSLGFQTSKFELAAVILLYFDENARQPKSTC